MVLGILSWPRGSHIVALVALVPEVAGPSCAVRDSAVLKNTLNKLSGDANGTGQGTSLWEPLVIPSIILNPGYAL